MSEDRDLERRVRSAIARVPVTDRPLGPPRRRGAPALVAAAAALAILVAAVVGGQWLSSYRAASAAARGCGPVEASVLPPGVKVLRTIRLDQRWSLAGGGSLCVAGIRVLDGGFQIVSYAEGTPSYAQPWFAAGIGFSLGGLSDDRGRMFRPASSSGFGRSPGAAHIETYQGFMPPAKDESGDLLAGVRALHYRVDRVLQAVHGPWRFDGIPARSGALTASATAAGRELRLYDLVLRPDGFSLAYLPLGQVVTGTIVVTEPLVVRDDRGTTYTSAGAERIGSSPNLYAKFTPAPPADAVLTVEIPTVYVSSDMTWQGELTLPAAP